jgi:tetratricopeptide (TPR) repeat protein
MTGAVWACALAAALFGLHPLRVESVAWISERKDVLSTLFWLLTMLSYVNYVQRGSRLSYAMALFWLAVGLLSKPMLVTLPCVLLLMDCWPLNRLARPGELEAGFWKRAGFWKTAGRLVLEKVPMFVLVAISCYVTLSVQRSGGAFLGLGSITYADRVANAALSYWIYPWLMIAPHDLAIVHPFSVTQVALWVRIVALASLLVSIVLAAVVYRRAPYVTVGWYWYLGTLVPVIGVVQVGVQAYADRYTYVPGIGIAIIVGWGLRDLVARAPRFRTAAVAASACALAVLAALTFQQLGHWKNTRTICEHTLAVTHENGLAHMTLGAYYMDQGDLGAALPHFEASARYLPSAARSHHYYAAALKKSGDYQPAIQEYRRALELGSEQPWDCYLGMAQSYYTLKDYPQASAMSRQAVEVYQKAKNADLTSARGLLAFSLVKQGRAAEATKVLEEQIALQPKNLTAVILAARIYATHQDAAVRNPTRAVKLADYAARLQEDTTTLDTLAAAQAAQGNFARAGESIQKAVELARRDAESHARTNPELSKRYLGLASELEGRGKLYEKGRPYREDPATYIQ